MPAHNSSKVFHYTLKRKGKLEHVVWRLLRARFWSLRLSVSLPTLTQCLQITPPLYTLSLYIYATS